MTHLDTLEIHGQCHTCGVPESLEHIALECNAAGQSLIWSLTRQLWAKKYAQWPKLNWGLVLGCNLLRFRTANGVLISEKGRLFAIIVSVAWNLIWNLRVSRVITHPNIIITDIEIHNRWLKAINGALQRDCLLCDKIKFGTLTLKNEKAGGMGMMVDWRTDGGFDGGLWPRHFAPAEFVHRYPCSQIHFFPAANSVQ